jgi:acetolactate synthase-1/2/3 large subunit
MTGDLSVTGATRRHGQTCDALAETLVAAGVRSAFSLMGDDTAALVNALSAVGVAIRSARHENIAVSMADGYSWVTGEPGLCVISRGPGAANALTAAVNAVRGGRAVLIVAGDEPARQGPGPDLKRFDHGAYAHLAGLHHVRVTCEDDPVERMQAALSVVRTGHPVLFTIQADTILAPTSWDPPVPAQAALEDPHPPAPVDVRFVVDHLAAAERPLLIGGAGAQAAGAALAALADATGALLGTTLKAKGLFAGLPYDVGVVGGFTNPVRRILLEEADCVVAFGASLSSLTTARGKLFSDVPIVQITTDSDTLGQHTSITHGVVADAGLTAEAVLRAWAQAELGTGNRFHTEATRERLARPLELQPTQVRPGSMDPQTLILRLDELLHPSRVVVADGGHHAGFPAMLLPVGAPGRFLYTLDFAAVGMGLGSALGVAAARPDQSTVLFIGDGGLSMTLGDLATVAAQQPSLVIVVMNDNAWGAERHFLDLLELPHQHAELDDVDFAAVAAGLGLTSARIDALEQLDAHAERLSAPAGAPLLLDCRIHPELRARWMDEF